MSASEICVSTVIVLRSAIDRIVGDVCVAFNVVPSRIAIETTVPLIGAKICVNSSCVSSVASVASLWMIDCSCCVRLACAEARLLRALSYSCLLVACSSQRRCWRSQFASASTSASLRAAICALAEAMLARLDSTLLRCTRASISPSSIPTST
jgi:hypothetical protein